MRRHELWLRDNRICHLCLDEVPLAEASRDHLIPVSVHRDDSPENLALAHSACNSYRSAFPIDHFSPEAYREARVRWLVRRDRIREPRPQEPDRRPRRYAWWCPFCGAANDSRKIRNESHAYRVCEACRARAYDPIGFEL